MCAAAEFTATIKVDAFECCAAKTEMSEASWCDAEIEGQSNFAKMIQVLEMSQVFITNKIVHDTEDS
jgi:hypothetical protein